MAERKLASIRRISEILPIEGADNIELAKVDGWQVVVKKGEFKPSDLCVYLEIDSWVPETVAPFLFKGREYQGVKGERLRTVKLRGALSQGLVLPMMVLYPNLTLVNAESLEGADVTEALGILKWDRPMPAQLTGQAKGYFPEFIRKTDQERCQNLTREIQDAYDNRDEFEVTIKLDGSSITVYHKDGEVGVCSRNLELKLNEENSENAFIRTATKTGLLDALKAYGKNIAVQGELMGEGIQGNRESLMWNQIFVFDIFDIDKQEYLDPEERHGVFHALVDNGFTGDHVPVVDYWECLPYRDTNGLLSYAEGPSLNHKIREGLVFKRMDGKFSFKAISNQFLLKEKD